MSKLKAEKKPKLKSRKKQYIMVSIFLLIVFLGVGVWGYMTYQNQQLLKDIKSHYHPVVSMNKQAHIYVKKDDEYQVGGTLDENFSVELEKAVIENIHQTYFKIKDTNYYIYYQDTKKGKKKDSLSFKYLLFNKNVTTKKDTTFYKDNKKVAHIKEKMNLPLMYMDDEYYYVTYLDEILGIKKSKSELVDHENTKEKDSNYVSVLHYEKIYKDGEKCTEDTCISMNQLEKELAILKEQQFYTISMEEFEKWLKGSLRLKEKAILLTYGTDVDLSTLKEKSYQMYLVNKDTSLKFQNQNHKVTQNDKPDAVPRYMIKNKTSDDDYKKMMLGEEVKEVVPETEPKRVNLTGNASRIAVLNYHFFYDAATEQCNQGICLSTAKFEEQLKYLKDNGWKTLTMEEFRAWMYGEIELPAKSVLLTVDDGGMGTGFSNGNKLIPLLEKYQAHATIFLITGWYFPPDYKSPYLDIESHTQEMHTEGVCSGVPRGAQMLCSTREQVLEDLKKSIQTTGSTKAFCYPFYAYNDTAIQLVRESGFKLAFQGGGYKATRNSNKMLVPRYAIHKNITLSSFINMIS